MIVVGVQRKTKERRDGGMLHGGVYSHGSWLRVCALSQMALTC